MITLDDVCRIKAILIAHGEWLEKDDECSLMTEDGSFEWVTSSCSGLAVSALVVGGYNVSIWPSNTYEGFLEVRISK